MLNDVEREYSEISPDGKLDRISFESQKRQTRPSKPPIVNEMFCAVRKIRVAVRVSGSARVNGLVIARDC